MARKEEEGVSDRRQKELKALIERAAQQPGVAEVLALQREYQAKLMALGDHFRQQHAVVFSTSDSTA